jgi:polar amino acid transport system ATP-binding protein
MPVLRNLMLAPVDLKKCSKTEAKARAVAMLKRVGLEEKANSYPRELSGGQKQRVAIARSLCMKPDIMLFDEPTSALDPELTGEVLKTMRELADEHMTMMVVTHEMNFAREAASHVVFVEGGVIVEEGPARQVIDNPQEERTQAFLKNML